MGLVLLAVLAYFGLISLMLRAAHVRVPRIKQKMEARRRRSQFRYVRGGKN